MVYLELQLGTRAFHARLADDVDAHWVSQLRATLPVTLELAQENWSGAFVSSVTGIPSGRAIGREHAQPYQYPGGVYLEAETGRVSICYGRGRLLDGFGPLLVGLLGEVVEPIEELATVCVRAQFDGPLSARLSVVKELPAGTPAVEQGWTGTSVRLTLGDAVAEAVLCDDTAPVLSSSFVAALPVRGTATNTHSSGPLMRFWNPEGGSEGRLPLEYSDDEQVGAQATLYPGHIYYLPKPTHAGLRITLIRPAIMRSPTGGPGLSLLRLGRLVGDWSAFAAVADRLRLTGQRPAAIELTDLSGT